MFSDNITSSYNNVATGVLYVCNHTFAALLMISDDQFKILQAMFSISGIVLSNTLVIIINWQKIKDWLKEIEWFKKKTPK